MGAIMQNQTTDRAVGVKELGHIVLYVRNITKSAEFYREVLGWKQISPAGAGVPIAAFSGGRTHHELLLIEVGADATPIPQGRRIGMYHFGLKVGDSDDELRAIVARLKAAGTTIVGSADHNVTHSIYLLDPDGNEIELYIDVPGVDWTDASNVLSAARPLSL
jgi:catechol 2,3-dioxygenase